MLGVVWEYRLGRSVLIVSLRDFVYIIPIKSAPEAILTVATTKQMLSILGEGHEAFIDS